MWREQAGEIKAFQEKLKKDFPNLYSGLGIHWRNGGMIGGISICKGWHDIIYKLSEVLENIIKNMDSKPRAAQIKEKFGSMRFHMNFETDEMKKIIEEAETQTAKTCEWCGNEGSRSTHNGWLKTLCDECHQIRIK